MKPFHFGPRHPFQSPNNVAGLPYSKSRDLQLVVMAMIDFIIPKHMLGSIVPVINQYMFENTFKSETGVKLQEIFFLKTDI